MTSIFGSGQKAAQREQSQQIKDARIATQDATEEELRARQKAERGGSSRRSRAVLMGNLSRAAAPANSSGTPSVLGGLRGGGLKRTVGA